MDRDDDLERLIVAAHAVTRLAALHTGSEAPAAQWRTLVILRDGGPLRLGELARQSRVTQPGMTRLVRQLEEAGLVVRDADAEDSRAAVLSITPAGRDAVETWMRQLVGALRPQFDGLDAGEWRALATTADVLHRIVRVPTAAGAAETVR